MHRTIARAKAVAGALYLHASLIENMVFVGRIMRVRVDIRPRSDLLQLLGRFHGCVINAEVTMSAFPTTLVQSAT